MNLRSQLSLAAGLLLATQASLLAVGDGPLRKTLEGMVPTRSASYAARVNLHLAKSLDAEVRVQTPTGEKTWYIVAIDYP